MQYTFYFSFLAFRTDIWRETFEPHNKAMTIREKKIQFAAGYVPTNHPTGEMIEKSRSAEY